ncbi:G5 domain-containing protein [Streptococcus parauberis]|uniref:G5 domain-containing protein n=1 Tax=Streptococcus parauberis TaxID=1348 RepID=UPI0021A62BF5|nr:G5 domain-containing protein [Streptococcus parauberis]UWM91171.1 G5 domain-containing protein [Streptococcus parauberis]WEM63187.1 G5 domain-containing protein [Streptococcus parauberis]
MGLKQLQQLILFKQKQQLQPASQAVYDDSYKWIDQPFYHVDTTQTLPSDRIVVDTLFVDRPPLTADYSTTESTVRELAQYSENYIYEYLTVTNPDGTTTQTRYIRTITAEMLDPTDTQLRSLLGLTDDAAFYSRLLTTAQEDMWTASAQDYGIEMVPEDLSTSTDDFLRYDNSNIINDAFYADIKADYQRAILAEQELEALGSWTTQQQTDMNMITDQFNSLTRRYNNYKGSISTSIDYSNTTMMSDTQKADFEVRIHALPEELQRIIADLVIYDNEIPGMGTGTLGLANSAARSIALKYEASNTSLMETVLHEMTHIIDFKSGLYVETSDRNTDGTLDTVPALSDTQEFLDIYHTYFDRSDVWPYYRDNSSEAFAEGLSQYIMHRLFGSPYATYVPNPYTGDAYDPGNGTGYSPFAATEFYFASLFNKLVGVDKVTAIAYQTEYRDNPTLLKGTQVVVTPGEDGQTSQPVQSYDFIQDGANSHFTNVQYGNPVIIDAQNRMIEEGTYVAPETPDENPAEPSKPEAKPQPVVVKDTKKEILTVATPKEKTPVKEAQLPTTGDKASSFSAIVSSSILLVTGLALLKKLKKDRN